VPPPEAVRDALGDAQVKVAEDGLTDAVGAVVSELIVADAVAVQPFAAVTVTVYVPALLTVMAAVVAPVLHE